MKLLYAANSNCGSNLQLKRFLDFNTEDIKVASTLNSGKLLSKIDWALDAVYAKKSDKTKITKLFGYELKLSLDIKNINLMLSDIADWKPDLILSELEPVSAHIGKLLNIPIWYCSPVLLCIGSADKISGQHKFGIFSKVKQSIKLLPKGERNFIYSPFGDILGRPILNNSYEWVKPYFELNDNDSVFVCNGETSYVADAFYAKRKICIRSSANDIESVLNGLMCENYGLGIDVGSCRQDVLESRLLAIRDQKSFDYISDQPYGFLHEKILNG